MLELRVCISRIWPSGWEKHPPRESYRTCGFTGLAGDQNSSPRLSTLRPDAPQHQDCPWPVYGRLMSAVLGTRLPGAKAVNISQTLNFRVAVRIGDTVQVHVKVGELIAGRHRARRAGTYRVGREVVLEGGTYQSAVCREQPSLAAATILKPRADPKARNSSQPERQSAPLRR
jgi:hypothetical protein